MEIKESTMHAIFGMPVDELIAKTAPNDIPVIENGRVVGFLKHPVNVILSVDDKTDVNMAYSEEYNGLEVKSYPDGVMRIGIVNVDERESSYYFRKSKPEDIEAVKKLILGLEEWVKNAK